VHSFELKDHTQLLVETALRRAAKTLLGELLEESLFTESTWDTPRRFLLKSRAVKRTWDSHGRAFVEILLVENSAGTF
jgi:hypothetical protein